MHATLTWAIAAATLAAIVIRPLRIPEWIWSVAGAAAIVGAGLLPGAQAAIAARDGLEVYCFLFGMLALAELSRVHGLFETVTDALLRRAGGSTAALFSYAFAGAVVVTALLSNDGTIVLLTPAALALARAANIVARPFAYAIAFVANAASFILPISNPANLVVFSPLPQLVPWLALFAAPSAAALLCTYAVLRGVHRNELQGKYVMDERVQAPSQAGSLTAVTVSCALVILILAAGLGWPVGYVAIALGFAATLVVTVRHRATARAVARGAPWSIVPLVAGLFVIVRALDATGALELARSLLRSASSMTPVLGRLYAGAVTTLADTAVNNLPAGVIARYALRGHGIAPHIAHAVLVGIDLGPNLSISGSLATLLWVMMLRREGIEVKALRFLAMGALVTVPSLALALLATR